MMASGLQPDTPAKALEVLARIYQHCEGLDSAPCEIWLERRRERVLIELCTRGTIEKARRAVMLLGGWSKPIKQKTVYKYPQEGAGYIITGTLRDEPPVKAYTTYRTIFYLPRRLILAIKLDPDEIPARVAYT